MFTQNKRRTRRRRSGSRSISSMPAPSPTWTKPLHLWQRRTLKSGMGLDGAGYLLLFHAVAVLSGVALLRQGLLLRPLVLGVLSGWVLGSALFAGDIALRAFVGYRLFPMAAPTGGVVLILAWLALAVAAILALLHS